MQLRSQFDIGMASGNKMPYVFVALQSDNDKNMIEIVVQVSIFFSLYQMDN